MRENALTDDVDPAPRILRLLASRIRLSGGPDAEKLARGIRDDALVLEGKRAMDNVESNRDHGRLLARERRVDLRRGEAVVKPKEQPAEERVLSHDDERARDSVVEAGDYELADADADVQRHYVDLYTARVREGRVRLEAIRDEWLRERVRARLAAGPSSDAA